MDKPLGLALERKERCQHPDCDALAPVMIGLECWICVDHIDWAMKLAFKPIKDAMKTSGRTSDL